MYFHKIAQFQHNNSSGVGIDTKVLSILFYFQKIYFYLLFLAMSQACGIPVPWPETESMPPEVEAWSLNHWTARDIPLFYFRITWEL